MADAVAKFYSPETATWYAGIMKGEMAKIEPELVRFVHELPAGAIIDTSCGTGHMLAWIRDHDPSRELHGIDLSPHMIAQAKALWGDLHCSEGSHGDLSNWADNVAAGVISSFCIHHCPREELPPVFSEWARVTKPGGRLLLGFWEGEGEMEGPDGVSLTRHGREWVKSTIEGAGFSLMHESYTPGEETGEVEAFLLWEQTRGPHP
jgi:SAM-dependent methyltransferase